MSDLITMREALRRDIDDLKRERDEAREALDEETKFHNRTHGELVQVQCQLQDAIRERDEARADSDEWQNKYAEVFVERDRVREALKRIADCDWVITLPDRMDAVRKIARDALEAAK